MGVSPEDAISNTYKWTNGLLRPFNLHAPESLSPINTDKIIGRIGIAGALYFSYFLIKGIYDLLTRTRIEKTTRFIFKSHLKLHFLSWKLHYKGEDLRDAYMRVRDLKEVISGKTFQDISFQWKGGDLKRDVHNGEAWEFDILSVNDKGSYPFFLGYEGTKENRQQAEKGIYKFSLYILGHKVGDYSFEITGGGEYSVELK